jgi:N-acetylglucosamine-6-phosphate deacetylase
VIVTLAPEADPDHAATRLLQERGVRVSLGHSTATYEDALAAADAGARLVTHVFNGMAPLHHRAPGLAGAALDDDRMTPTIIADLVHVHPVALRLAIGRKRNVALVTDRVTVRGVQVADDGAARLPDGTLVGSTLSMDHAVRNVVGLGVPIERALEMAATIPAQALGLNDRGRIVPGARADLVALDPDSLAVRAVWLAGELTAGAAPS